MRALTLFAGLIFTAPATAQEFAVQDHQITASGPVKLLSGWACWFPDCRFANCNMQTTTKPQLGALKVEILPTTIPSSGGNCAGRPTPGLTITYTPRAGVHGADKVELRSIADNGHRHLLRYAISVP